MLHLFEFTRVAVQRLREKGGRVDQKVKMSYPSINLSKNKVDRRITQSTGSRIFHKCDEDTRCPAFKQIISRWQSLFVAKTDQTAVVAAASGSGEKGHGCDHASAATFKKNLYKGRSLKQMVSS
jgi:hypothetical protein